MCSIDIETNEIWDTTLSVYNFSFISDTNNFVVVLCSIFICILLHEWNIESTSYVLTITYDFTKNVLPSHDINKDASILQK